MKKKPNICLRIRISFPKILNALKEIKAQGY